MNEDRPDSESENNPAALREERSGDRVRFSGIVEADDTEVLDDDTFGPFGAGREWQSVTRQVWIAARLTALFIFASLLFGSPLGDFAAHLRLHGTAEGWNWLAAYDFTILIFAFIVPLLILLMGYMFSRLFMVVDAIKEIAVAAQQMTTPDVAAARNLDTVGDVMRTHMDTFNDGLDSALSRLASVEAMIRQHVDAIEIAGDAIEQKATSAVTRVADERARLMELTESLNAHADSFAAAIAERAKASIEALEKADQVPAKLERDFEKRLHSLEAAANQAVGSFDTLCAALAESDQSAREAASRIDEAALFSERASERANTASNAAAESAALNAANVAASADRASKSAREAAAKAIDDAREQTEAVAHAAIEATRARAEDIRAATDKAVSDMTAASEKAATHAQAHASDATKATKEITTAAKAASQAAQHAADNVAKATQSARKNAEDALEQTQSTKDQLEDRNKALVDARHALEKENERLETLIEEQRKRADRIADAITSQTERLSKLAETQLREQEAAAKIAETNRQSFERAEQERKALEAEVSAKKSAPKRVEPQREQRQQKPATTRQRSQRDAEPVRVQPTQPDPGDAARLDEIAAEIAKGGSNAPASNASNSSARREASPRNASPNRREKSDVSWREILDAADDSEPLDLASASKKPAQSRSDAAAALKIISELQDFTYELENRLYGPPPPGMQERYDNGDRNVFANRLLRLNEADVKRRIRTEAARERRFEASVHQFLQSFEKLLEDATTSQTADEELEEYLSSPLGRVYLLIGATVGYFA